MTSPLWDQAEDVPFMLHRHDDGTETVTIDDFPLVTQMACGDDDPPRFWFRPLAGRGVVRVDTERKHVRIEVDNAWCSYRIVDYRHEVRNYLLQRLAAMGDRR